MKRLFHVSLLSLSIWITACAPAFATVLLQDLDTSTPAATLRSFQTGIERMEGLYAAYQKQPTLAGQLAMVRSLAHLSTQLFDLHDVAPAIRQKTGNTLMGYMFDVLNRLPPIDPATIPGGKGGAATDLPARWTIPGTEIRIVRLAEGQRAGDYVFSADTVARLSEFHAQIIDQPLLRPSPIANFTTVQRDFVGPMLAHLGLENLPAPLRAPFFGTPIWKIALSFIIILAILVVLLFWTKFVSWRAANAIPWRRHLLWLTVPMLLAVLAVVAHLVIQSQVVLSIAPSNALTIFVTIVLYAAAAWGAWRSCWLLAEVIIASRMFPDSIYDASLMRIVARVSSMISAAGLLIYGGSDVGLPALGLLAGVSIGGIAFALAAQSTVENLFGGVSIFADRPFRVGDSIRFGSHAGTVESVGPRSTRIRGADGTLTTVPNADLAKSQITNISARASSLFQQSISLPGNISSAQIEALLAEMRHRIEAHPLVENGPGQPRVRLTSFGAGGGEVTIEVFARVQTTVMAEFLEVQEALILQVLRAVEGCNLSLTGLDHSPGDGSRPGVAGSSR